MRAPLLDRQMTLEAPQRLADGAGGYQTTWTVLGTLWARVQSGRGRESRSQSAPISRVPYTITVRGAPQGSDRRPVAGQRLRDGARIFVVLAVTEADPNGRYLTVSAEEETVR